MNTNINEEFEILRDPEFRRSFRENPRRHLREMGLEKPLNIGKDADIVVKTNTSEKIYIPLPASDSQADYKLSVSDLDKIGGASVYDRAGVGAAGCAGSLSSASTAATVTSTVSSGGSASTVGSVGSAGST